MYASNGVPNDKFSMISQMYDRLMTWLEDQNLHITARYPAIRFHKTTKSVNPSKNNLNH